MPKYIVKKSYTDRGTNTLCEMGDIVELTKKRADEINEAGKLYFGEEVELVSSLKISELDNISK